MHLISVTYCPGNFINYIFCLVSGPAGNILTSETSPYRYILYGAVIIAFVYLAVRSQTRRLIITRRLLKEKEIALEVIAEQKIKLEMREKEITDSLVYAQRIQEALLPSENYFRQHIEDSFIFFKPKDIVSGDFYWIGEKSGKVFVVAADCTGHGVPGAIISMIGLEIIEKTINEDLIETPSKILDLLDKGLERTFSRKKNTGTIIRDGMDLGLCVIDKAKRKIVFAGAFFPLYLIRDNRLTEIKGNKIIVGMNPEGLGFNDNELDLEDGDVFYLFSDGYADQFGGEGKKKFMYRRFRHLLLTIHTFPVEDQKSILEENLRTWMGDTWQVDDILVIGFKPLGTGS
jgi:serine phosphatase RsbU (regulator of sigma subunit)